MDKKTIQKILEANKEKGFVQRILNPSNYPVLDLGKGKTATHMMSWGQVGDKYVVYPTVLYDENKGLTQYSPAKAWHHVSQTGNFIVFSNAKEADWFSKNYKIIWDKKSNK